MRIKEKLSTIWARRGKDGDILLGKATSLDMESVEECVVLWKEDYDAMRKELEEWRSFKEKNKAMWQGAVKLIKENHD